MHYHHYLVCLVFLVSVVIIDADSTLTAPKNTSKSALQPQKSTFQATNKIDITVARLLRTLKAPDNGHQEERAGGPSYYEKLKSLFTLSKGTPKNLKQWLKEEKSVDTVFKKFHLDKSEYFLFDRPHFAAWVEYADALSAKFPDMSAISTLTKRYGDVLLDDMIQSAKRSPDTKYLAIKLENERMQHWLTIRKDPDVFFRLLQLNWDRAKMLAKPEFVTWAKYVSDLNTKHPENPTWMYSTLTKYFNDDGLFQLTGEAQYLEKTKAIAIKVEDDWLQAGIHSHKTPYQVLETLGLGQTTDKLLEKVVLDNSLVTAWVKYTKHFNNMYPDEKTTMLETFTKAFGNIGVMKMLHTAKWEKRTKNFATNIESEQLKMWLSSGKTIDDVFNLLKLNKEVLVYRVLDEHLFRTWVSYINAYIMANPEKKAAVFFGLQSNFEDKPLNMILNEAKKYSSMENTATKVQMDKIPTYLANNKLPRDVFELLELKYMGSDILGSALFNTWMKYVEVFNKRNPNHQESWFDAVRSNLEYGGAQTIEKAMKNPNTVEVGKKLEKEWLNFWLDRGQLPNEVFRSLALNKAGEHVLADPKFRRWTTYLGAFNEKYPDKQTAMIDGFLDNFKENHLVQIFKTAKEDPTTEKLAASLQDALIDKWIVEGLKVEELRQILSGGQSAEEMVERYVTKLATRKTL